MKSLLIKLPFLPPSVNKCYYTDRRSFTRHKSADYRRFIKDIGHFLPKKQIRGEIEVKYDFFFPDKRKRDAFNFEKALTDSLVSYGIIEDDSLIKKGTIEKHYQKGDPQTYIEINQIN